MSDHEVRSINTGYIYWLYLHLCIEHLIGTITDQWQTELSLQRRQYRQQCWVQTVWRQCHCRDDAVLSVDGRTSCRQSSYVLRYDDERIRLQGIVGYRLIIHSCTRHAMFVSHHAVWIDPSNTPTKQQKQYNAIKLEYDILFAVNQL